MWGSSQPIYPLFIQGKRLHIRQNLWRFLREYPAANKSSLNRYNTPSYDHYHYDESGGLLWIDQICINQSDVRERNHQVSLMSKIYKNCEFVITWIGDVDDSAICSKSAREFTTTFKPDAIVPILCNPYFSRLWIVQEIILARFVRVLVEGGEWVLWSDMQCASDCISERNEQQLRSFRSSALALLQTGTKARDRKRDLLWLFRSFHMCDCEDPRDKVYGLMGLVNSGLHGLHLNLRVDYAKSVHDTFLATVEELYRSFTELENRSKSTETALEVEMVDVLLALGISMGLNNLEVIGGFL